MNERGLFGIFLTLISINLVSAQFYGSFSISDALRIVEPSTMVLGIIFIAATILINTTLSRTGPLRYNRTGAGIISVALGLLIIWGVDRMGWDYYNFFNSVFFFVPAGLLETFWPLLFIVCIIFVWWKLGWKYILIFLGSFFTILGFFSYESGILWMLGGALLVIGIIFIFILKKKDKDPIDWRKYGRGALTSGKYTGIAGKYAAGKVGSGIKKGFGWGKGKWDQRQYNKRYDEALREDAEREKMKREQKAQQAEAEQQKRQYQEQQRTQEKQRAQQEKQQAQQRKQIRYDIKQRINSLKKEYNDLQRQNPRHPRLYEIVKEIKELKRQL
jgi:hypothetical protein